MAIKNGLIFSGDTERREDISGDGVRGRDQFVLQSVADWQSG